MTDNLTNYGTLETNPVSDTFKENSSKIARAVSWDEPGLRINRLRLLSDPGLPFWDVSYCTGVLPSGEWVDVTLPFQQLPKRGYKRAIVAYAKKDSVYAVGLGIFPAISTLC